MSEAEDRALAEVERAVVYTPKRGDVVVLEVGDRLTVNTVNEFKERAQAAFGMEVKVVVLVGMHFAGVVRDV